MSDRYTETFPGDSDIQSDGDSQFIGMDARILPEKLPPGMVAYSQNMRFTNFTAQVRLGMAKQTNGIIINGNALIVPFTVGSSAIITSTVTDGVYGALTFSDPNNNNNQSIIIFCGSKAYALTATSALTSITYPANELVESTDQVDYYQYGDNVYLFRGDLGVSIPVASLTSATTTATLTTTTAHGLFTGQYIQIGGATQAPYNGNFPVTVTGTSTLTFTISGTTTSPATGTITVNRLKLPMKWNGVASGSFVLTNFGVIAQNFSYLAPSNFGMIQANRAIMEQGRNSLIVSQVEAPESYDTINGVFNFGPGTADYLIGVAPYQDNYTLVFLRHSIWLIDGITLDVAAMSTQLITASVGSVGKRTIATCGADIVFLSDLGVYRLEPGFELSLRGNALPLSAPIDPIIRTINFSATNVPCAAYTNNRYYLAVPLNGATRNNAMLVYNFINQTWESIDTFPNGFFCDFLTVEINAAGVPTLFCLSREGGVYAYEQNEQDDFAAASSPPVQYLINGQITTRRYTFGNNSLKKFTRAIVNYQLDPSSSMACEAIMDNPTATRTLPTVTATASGLITRPMIINKRAYGCQLQFSNTAQRGTVQNFQIGAYLKDLKSVATS